MIQGRPLFTGQNHIDQLDVIFKLCGTPTHVNWPSHADLPWYKMFKPQHMIDRCLREHLESAAVRPLRPPPPLLPFLSAWNPCYLLPSLCVWYLNSGQHTDLYACSPGCIKRLTLLQADSTNETSEHAIDLLDKLLVLDPNSRVSAEKMLEHEYFWTGAYAAATHSRAHTCTYRYTATKSHIHRPVIKPASLTLA
jgi:serine/threonine protein kinase